MNDPDLDPDRKMTSRQLVVAAFWFQGSLAVVGIVAGAFGMCDRSQSLLDFDQDIIIEPAFAWGVLGTIPMLGYLLCAHFFPVGPLKHVRDVVEEKLYPLLKDATVFQMVLLSVLAGFTEEILFRWCLQGGLNEFFGGQFGWLVALLLASMVFGAMHCINWSYAILTTLVGVYLGWLMIASGTYLAPAIAHTLFDFIALIYIVRWLPSTIDRYDPVGDDDDYHGMT
jgi:membrane protease YdiL (CAAX protease family)